MESLAEFDTRESGATFSPDRKYRYKLWRAWNSDRRLLFIMLNPSIADEERDDATQRRCRRFAKDWGFGGYTVGNLFALVSTDPKGLKTEPEPIGPENDDYLTAMHKAHSLTVVAWGTHGTLGGRDRKVLQELLKSGPVFCLGLNKDGTPKHPLYVRADTRYALYDQNIARL